MEEDKNVYIKDGRRYRPIGYWFTGHNDWLNEGVWVVSKRPGHKSITSGNYLKELYGIDKMGNLTDMSYADLGRMEDITWEVYYKLCNELDNSNGKLIATVRRVVSEVFKLTKEDNEKKM